MPCFFTGDRSALTHRSRFPFPVLFPFWPYGVGLRRESHSSRVKQLWQHGDEDGLVACGLFCFSAEPQTGYGRLCRNPQLCPDRRAAERLLDVCSADLRCDFDHQEDRAPVVAALSTDHDIGEDGIVALRQGKNPTVERIHDEPFVFFPWQDSDVADEPSQRKSGDLAVAPFNQHVFEITHRIRMCRKTLPALREHASRPRSGSSFFL